MLERRWERVSGRRLTGFAFGLVLFIGLVMRSELGFVFCLDHANLLFHEAGHPVLGLFGDWIAPYGGTIGQLTFPCVLMVSFWRKGQPIPFACSIIWFFENWLNISRYMADARVQELPLVGGGDHDWNAILGRWGLLEWDTRIAMTVRILGIIGMILPVVWVAWRWWQDRKRVDDAGC